MSKLLSFVYKILAQSTKSLIVDAITLILRKIQNPIEFESFLQFRPKPNCSDSIYNYIELFVSKLKFYRSKIALFRKMRNFMKSEYLDFFLNSIPNVFKHWSLYEEVFSSVFFYLRQLERLQIFFKKYTSS